MKLLSFHIMYRRATGLEGFKSEGLSVRGFYFILLFLELYYVFLISNSAISKSFEDVIILLLSLIQIYYQCTSTYYTTVI